MSKMLPVFRIIKPGIYCAFQDLGRFGYRHLGVPWSGAMDRLSYLYVNQKLGNHITEPLIEIMGQGFTIEVLENVSVFWAGAECVIEINGHTINNPDKPINLKSGQILALSKQDQGNWTYLGISPGFHIEQVMGSASTMKGTHLTTFQKLDIIWQKASHDDNDGHHGLRHHALEAHVTIKVFRGPEFSWLKSEDIGQIIHSSFFISKDISRMGYRLLGPNIFLESHRECITSSVLPGTIQLLPSGQMIVLMRECQTTGGYPRILQLDEYSISKLAQKRSGESITFDLV
jgi:biotin-dependent carboxylase-like uncharacterized protein